MDTQTEKLCNFQVDLDPFCGVKKEVHYTDLLHLNIKIVHPKLNWQLSVGVTFRIKVKGVFNISLKMPVRRVSKHAEPVNLTIDFNCTKR